MNFQIVSNVIYRGVFFINIVLWLILIGSVFFMESNLQLAGKEMGNWAIRTLWIVTLPGILKRFQARGFLQKIQIVIMRSRRRLGVLTFTLILIHFSWQRLFFYIETGALPKPGEVPLFETMGLLALIVLTPLFLTSNNFAVKTLKSMWQKIHYLIYGAVWLVALHVMFQGLYFEAIVTGVIILLQISSWGVYWKNKSKPEKVNQSNIVAR